MITVLAPWIAVFIASVIGLWLVWFRTSYPDPSVIYPFRLLNDAMREKDPALYDEVGPLHPYDAMCRWREVYPEDFVGVEGHSPVPGPEAIKQKSISG